VKLEQTLDKTLRALYEAKIPHLVSGGYALQDSGHDTNFEVRLQAGGLVPNGR